jgi:hypothetical protein
MLTMTSVVSFRSLQITRRKASLAWLPPLRLEGLTVVAAVAAEECAADELDSALAQLLLLLFIVVRWPCTCAAKKTRESGSLFFLAHVMTKK